MTPIEYLKKWPGVGGEPEIAHPVGMEAFLVRQGPDDGLGSTVYGEYFGTAAEAITAWNEAVDACVKAASGQP